METTTAMAVIPQVFTNEEFGEVRTIFENGEIKFVAADCCRALEIKNNRDAISRLDDDEKGVAIVDTLGGAQKMSVVTEAGLYRLIFMSRKPNAKKFQRWIFHEVIPSIRREGGYAAPGFKVVPENAITVVDANGEINLDLLIRLAQDLKAEREASAAKDAKIVELAGQVERLLPKSEYCDKILACPDVVPVSVIAKDYGFSGRKFNQLLHQIGVQFRQGDMWLLYQGYAELGWAQSQTHRYFDEIEGVYKAKTQTYWTQSGRLGLYHLLKERGVLPVVDRIKIQGSLFD